MKWTFGTAPLNFHVISCFEPPCHASLSGFTWLMSAPPRRPSIFIVGEPGDIRDALAERAGLVEGRDVAAAAVPHATVARRAGAFESERVINESIIERLVYTVEVAEQRTL